VKSEFITDIGLEVHVELNTKTKIFCGCESKFGGEPNTRVCEVCLGLPGALPRLNQKVYEAAVRCAMALDGRVAERTRFDRKNYFYPDLPKGYQISQLYAPICEGGYIDIIDVSGATQRIRIHEMHMEEDAGKLIHDTPRKMTHVDYNRAGVPLLEIVTEPDFHDANDVATFLQVLRDMMVYLGISDCKMEEGSMRVDVNVSIRPVDSEALGTRTEMKNLSSIRAVTAAIRYEADRQCEVIAAGKMIERETRRFDEVKMTTKKMRSKESGADYRYFPEPDIPCIVLSDERRAALKKTIPEMRLAKIKRYVRDFILSEYDATCLTVTPEMATLFETATEVCHRPQETAHWMMGELSRVTKEIGMEPNVKAISGVDFGIIIALVSDGKITRNAANTVLFEVLTHHVRPEEYIESHGFDQSVNPDELEATIKQVLDAFPKAVEGYRAGQTKNLTFLMGQAMKMLGMNANPKIIREKIESMIT